MIPLVLGEVRMTDVAREPVLILRERAGDRLLPVWITAAAAHGILAASDEPQAAVGTHQLLLEVLARLDHAVSDVRILGIEDGIYRAELRIGQVSVPARISDALAVAIRCGAMVLATQELMDTVALVDPQVSSAGQTADVQLERFRAFLDSIAPEDFEGPEGKPSAHD
ncbi:MAG: bifunctional nuclease family protein [Propioniciclava sp.]